MHSNNNFVGAKKWHYFIVPATSIEETGLFGGIASASYLVNQTCCTSGLTTLHGDRVVEVTFVPGCKEMHEGQRDL